MVFDDIIIGSGLTALATAYGLPKGRRVLVLTGGASDQLGHYAPDSGIPCFNQGFGGLGNFWHGVIPMQTASYVSHIPQQYFSEIFSIFYPSEPVLMYQGFPWLFVPHQPIRPKKHWQQLVEASNGNLTLIHTYANTIQKRNKLWEVSSVGNVFSTTKLWVAAGALGTPALLERSDDFSNVTRKTASDHFILYLGKVDRKLHPNVAAPVIKRSKGGYWMKTDASSNHDGLITKKPARFSYKILDHGIEQRSAFGLPTSGAINKVLRAGSLGLIAESIFNKFGVFPNADTLSVYGQMCIQDCYHRLPDMKGLHANTQLINVQLSAFRKTLNIPGLIPSQRPELHIRGIHLHHTVDNTILTSLALNNTSNNFSIVDASAIDHIGAEHHSFRLMTQAYYRASIS